jgi:hypothetical protein
MEFDQRLDHLPDGLQVLIIGGSYDQSLDYLPDSLKLLSINYRYSHKLDHLPEGLETLRLNNYDGTLDHLPSSLLHLDNSVFWFTQAPRRFNHLPFNLQTLKVDHLCICEGLPLDLDQYWNMFSQSCCLSFYSTLINLKKLRISLPNNCQNIVWPPHLTHLFIDDHPLDFDLGILPETLEYLTISNLNDSTCSRWPNSLRYICVKQINASKIPKNRIETILSHGWHNLLNQSQFPDLKRLTVRTSKSLKTMNCSFWHDFDASADLHDYDFSLESISGLEIPKIWPLKLFNFCDYLLKVSIITPWSEQLPRTDQSLKVFENNNIFNRG